MKMRYLKLAAALLACTSFASAQTKYVGWSTGYLAGWAQGNYPPSKIVWKAYTHMCHFSATPTSTGGCNLGMGINGGYASALTSEAHKHNVKAILCVGGAGEGGHFKSSASAANRTAFIANMIALMKQYQYDGLDIDWEEGTGGADYVNLFKETRDALDKITPRPLLTSAVGSYYSSDLGKVAQYADQLNDMCYWTLAKNLDGEMAQLVKMGIPKTKLGVGIGLDFKEGNPEVDCDPAAAKAKCLYAINGGYGGIMTWEIERDADKFGGQTPVHDTMSHYVTLVPVTSTLAGNAAMNGGDPILTVDGNRLGALRVSYTVASGDLAGGALVDLSLHDLNGSLVKTMVHGRSAAGMHTIGLGESGSGDRQLHAGAYIVKLTTGSGTKTAKAILVP